MLHLHKSAFAWRIFSKITNKFYCNYINETVYNRKGDEGDSSQINSSKGGVSTKRENLCLQIERTLH